VCEYANSLGLRGQQEFGIYARNFAGAHDVAMPAKEKEWGDKARRFVKAELKRAGIGYKELAERLNKHGMEETESGIASKLSRGTFAVAFFLACLAVLELEGIDLADL
jgi:hypothetical protein